MTIQGILKGGDAPAINIIHSIASLPQGLIKIMELSPETILGESHLFFYDVFKQQIRMSRPFSMLLSHLVDRGVLSDEIRSCHSLSELNQVLQRQQGGKGGFLRPNGVEGWDLNDQLLEGCDFGLVDSLLIQLGFVAQRETQVLGSVDCAVIFGTRADAMSDRVQYTIDKLEGGLEVKESIFLLGSNRKLSAKELAFIDDRVNTLTLKKKNYWKTFFSSEQVATEIYALLFFWNTQAPSKMRYDYQTKVFAINSTKIGHSFDQNQGYRVTTEVTLDDMIFFMDERQSKSIFALSEQPYLRLTNQLRMKILKGKGFAGLERLVKRVQEMTFHFFHPKPHITPCRTTCLDEIARHVYSIITTMRDLTRVRSRL